MQLYKNKISQNEHFNTFVSLLSNKVEVLSKWTKIIVIVEICTEWKKMMQNDNQVVGLPW